MNRIFLYLFSLCKKTPYTALLKVFESVTYSNKRLTFTPKAFGVESLVYGIFLSKTWNRRFFLLIVCMVVLQAVNGQNHIPAADHPGGYLPLLLGKKVGLVINHSSTYRDSMHMVDYLLHRGVEVVKIFAPEHGYLGKAGAGEQIGDDKLGNLEIISLYGKKKKPNAEDVAGLDVILFDIQDVGVRFYTYISTLSYVMERAGEENIPVIVLDRPNPHRHYIDGPVLDTTRFRSFVGLHPVPVVYGLTIGEYAKMVNGEKWISHPCSLHVVYCRNYNIQERYELPIPPSPNLPNHNAILLYPSLCFFEGTPVSVGRGTDKPFQVIGAPWFTSGDYHFTPKSVEAAPKPKFINQRCKGFNLTNFAEGYINNEPRLYLAWLIAAYETFPGDKKSFFTNFFDLLAGTDQLRKDIIAGKKEDIIAQEWLEGLSQYAEIRSKYAYYD
ncbi:MAG: DUF1343 domain-containing protein [Cryomorphaceae bacterium]|nr:DUF1343 domain-containing protein [Cryomorphaceae bacterium]